ncbi:hypothetical protein XENOCAPTIV_019955 [Xenoophorus captivus]|uniref:Uncharacterized protein n=1 Tax=Xenoophorus captivus TaxID=1517983 RepID=A0ABV0RVM1_9TELE
MGTKLVFLISQALETAGQRCTELEEALNSRSQELEMLQQEVSSADQQKQVEILNDLDKDKMEVSRLEAELARMKEAELAAAQGNRDASERDGAEISRLQSELASLREAESAAGQAMQETLEQERSKVDNLQKELATLREEQEDVQKKEILAEIWRHLRSLAPETMPEEVPDPVDPSLLLNSVRSVETQLMRLKDEGRERSEQCAQLTNTMEDLQGKELFFYCQNVSLRWRY